LKVIYSMDRSRKTELSAKYAHLINEADNRN
jgi:hypothetical protein